MKITINKNKNIGKVIYVVEGDVTEPSIIKTIFNKLLNYEVNTYKKHDDSYSILNSKTNKYSKVYVIPSKNPQINQIEKSQDYFYNILNNKFEISSENSAIYYIFDRDRNNNRPTTIKNHIAKYCNSRDNDTEMNGLFLLSYPCIEACYLNALNDKNEFSCGQNIKDYVNENEIDFSVFQKDYLLIDFAKTVIDNINKIYSDNFKIEDLDDFKKINLEIFDYEEKCFNKRKVYITLSLLIISLIDLGIIEITQ